jgi:NADH:ubiquinone oxidoreductase subunit C
MLVQNKVIFITQFHNILKKFIQNIKIKNLYYELNALKEHAYLLIFFLKFHYLTKVDCFIDITVIDRINKKNRFTIIYNLLSFFYNMRFFVKIKITEITKILSINTIFFASNWYEREVWDMFGIFFLKHPDLRRLLTDYNFQGYPLRKDFPLSGFVEVFYSSVNLQLIYKYIKLSQSYRYFFSNIN